MAGDPTGLTVRLPDPCLVVLIGPSGSGKSAWVTEHFRESQVVSTDRLRALVGEGERDQRAGTDAFAVLDVVLERRMKRRLVTVIDSLGLDTTRRGQWRDVARRHGVPAYAVVFDTPPQECRSRNKARGQPVPANVVTAQLKSFAEQRPTFDDEGFAAVHPAGPVRLLPPEYVDAPAAAARQRETPMSLAFGLQIPRFEGGAAELRPRLTAIAQAAEAAGFDSVWVMDHFLQIPQVGREWEDMLDSYTTLGFLAAATERVRLGTLVTGVTYRNVAHLGKIVATLDVLSGGRAVCGIGAAWFEREHRAYGWRFPPVMERFALLEDALELLPLMWGPGTPSFKGRIVEVESATCYPRPLQEHVPVLVGGSGERRTLKLVAQHADACNLFGDAATVRHKVEVLHRHCADAGRDPSDITVTHLSRVLEGATEEEHVGHYRVLAEAGVQTAIVSFPALDGPKPIDAFAPVIRSFPRE